MSDERRRAMLFAAVLTVTVGALAGVVARMTVLVPMHRAASTVEARVGATLVTVLGVAVAATVLAVLTVGPLYAVLSDRVRVAPEPSFVLLALGVVACVVIGFVGVQPFAGGFADAHTDTYGGFGGPHADFEVSVDWVGDGRAIVTFTHAGGDPLLAEHVYVRGKGFAAIDGADHQEPGPWQGTVSGERPRRGGAAVVDGDSVSVGVTGECMVGLVYDGDDMGSVIAGYECPEHRTVA